MTGGQKLLWFVGADNIPRRANESKGSRKEARYTCSEGDGAWTAVDPLLKEQEAFGVIRATKEEWAED
ncbi:hypothetical protein [Singulisphaera sp. PoT]|uniref:hypothetical protein n=1 Tax=Singulisphaera sp. PoT TaxID=3411797 RepID=UPI003BF5939D